MTEPSTEPTNPAEIPRAPWHLSGGRQEQDSPFTLPSTDGDSRPTASGTTKPGYRQDLTASK